MKQRMATFWWDLRISQSNDSSWDYSYQFHWRNNTNLRKACQVGNILEIWKAVPGEGMVKCPIIHPQMYPLSPGEVISVLWRSALKVEDLQALPWSCQPCCRSKCKTRKWVLVFRMPQSTENGGGVCEASTLTTLGWRDFSKQKYMECATTNAN